MESNNKNWLARLESAAEIHAPLVLTLMISAMFVVGSFALKAHPIQLDSGETKTWWGIATNLTRGYGYSLCNQYYFPFCDAAHSATAMREPAPVLFFAGVAALTNESLFVAGVTQLCFLVLILAALFFLTLEWTKSPLAALVAAFLWTVYPRSYPLVTQISGDLMAGMGVTLGALFVLRARRTDKLGDWILAGAGLALAFMSRSAMLMVALTVLAGLIIERWKLKSRLVDLLRPSLIISATLALFLVPWLIRTDLVFGRPLIGSSLVGYNIFRHNSALTTNDYF
ncbi:MAG: glycosyltransferase family 39 protein, partial [Anaerolineales bacterium]|nr:glycosyltransferase family 39 protein [Anaerolineales bacterium]